MIYHRSKGPDIMFDKNTLMISFRKFFISTELILVVFLSSCSSMKIIEKAPKKIQKVVIKQSSLMKNEEKSYIPSSFKERFAAKYLSLKYNTDTFNKWVKYFTNHGKKNFEGHLKNGLLYRNIVREILGQHGLPEDLFFVGLIESGYNSKIKSHANAVGHWQFIDSTGKHYGLMINDYVDERRSIYKSTHAAASYFKDLYNIFGSWELALCAYNAGEFRVINAIRKGNTRDYVKLIKMNLLPDETANYVAKVAAARYVFRNLKKYDVKAEKKNFKFLEKVRSVRLRQSFNLKKMSEFVNVPLEVMSFLNPDLKRNTIRIENKEGMKIYIPKIFSKKNVRKLASFSKKSPKKKKDYRVGFNYKVVRGDNLYSIAKKFSLSINDIKNSNKLKKNKLYVGQFLKIPEVKNKVHTVKKGETLINIAKKFGVELEKLVETNSLKNAVIFPSQRLIVPL